MRTAASIRRTKIVATLGPATDNLDRLVALIQAGANVMRINMSHGPHEEHRKRIHLVHEAAKKLNKPIGIIADLQGPKIRVCSFRSKEVMLTPGQKFCLSTVIGENDGDQHGVALDYPQLIHDLKVGDTLLLNDGRIELKVERVTPTDADTKVIVGGILSNHKGINRKGGGLSAPPLTDKDIEDIAFLATQDVDYIALSFVKTVQDIALLRRILLEHNMGDMRVISKIETIEAIKNLEEIIEASDAVMVARGDLGVELGFAELPALQKEIIFKARQRDKTVITATQMMESMIHEPVPTRAEVSDVANAALDGTDAVMLSAESAVGQYPVETVKALNDICLAAERQKVEYLSRERVFAHFDRVDESIAMASMYLSNKMNLKAILALSESGSTPLWMSRIRSSVPIYALCRHARVRRIMSLFRGVHPIDFDVTQCKPWEVSLGAIGHLYKLGLIAEGDRVLLTKGDIMGVYGGANTLKIITLDAEYISKL
ncbi:MAG: pyruvate kinase [Pseudomonadota bacterium]